MYFVVNPVLYFISTKITLLLPGTPLNYPLTGLGIKGTGTVISSETLKLKIKYFSNSKSVFSPVFLRSKIKSLCRETTNQNKQILKTHGILIQTKVLWEAM